MPDHNNTGCQICGLSNHIADICRRHYTQQQTGPRPLWLVNYINYGTRPNTFNTGNFISWYLNIGSNFHTIPDITNLHSISPYQGAYQLHVRNGQGLNVDNIGEATLSSPTWKLTLNNILHVPNIVKNLLSVQKFTTGNNYFFEFWPNFFVIKG